MKKTLIVLALLAALAGGIATAWYNGWVALAYYWLIVPTPGQADAPHSLGLADYRATIDALPLEGIDRNASGLTYHPERKTLFAVINHPPQVVELSTDGKLLRTIPVNGASDLEGITHIGEDVFALSDEARHQIFRVRINDKTTAIDVQKVPRFGLAFDAKTNLGYEGLSWDHVNQRLFVVKEKKPLRVFHVSGLRGLLSSGHFDLQIAEWKPAAPARLMMTDLSSLTYHEATGHLLLLSDESHLVAEFDEAGLPVGLLALRAGWHGLKATVPQAEGLAVGDDGTVYVLSEPNLFYRFERRK